MTHCEGFWATLELLVSLRGSNDFDSQLLNEETNDWLDNVSSQNFHFPFSSKEDTEESENQKQQIDYHPLIECNITHPRVKSRLETLMGSNIVRLTDRKYMLKLMSKIRQDHEAKQQIRIEERMKKELMRTKTMILNRLIPIQDAPEDIQQYPLFQLYLYCDSIIQKTHKKETRKLIRLRESLYRMLYPIATGSEENEDDEEENVYFKKITVGTETELIPFTNEEVFAYLKEQEKNDIERGYMLSEEEFDRIHYETDGVKSLREAKTVEEMYAKAHAIVGILYSYTDEGRYKDLENDENEKEFSENQDTEDEKESTEETEQNEE